MIRATTFKGKTVAVFGLGGSGLATARSLLEGGAIVLAWDDGEPGRKAAAEQAIPVADLATADWSRIDSLVLAPGVPLTHPEPHWVVLKAREESDRRLKAREESDRRLKAREESGKRLKAREESDKRLKAREEDATRLNAGRESRAVEIIGDIEIFARERAAHAPDAPFIAITGTNGKSTTTALVAHILRRSGRDVQMGGNIGRAILTLEPPARDRFHVIEMSSFQIDLTPSLAPTVGVLLNITPDHLDRHGPADDLDLALRNYAAIKERLVQRAHIACVGIDDDLCRAILNRRLATGAAVAFSATREFRPGYCLHDGWLICADATGLAVKLGSTAGVPTLRGAHNAQNALAAVSAVRECWAALARDGNASVAGAASGFDYQPALASYPGLPHRLEEIGRLGRVVFINDSKATNADSTEVALAALGTPGHRTIHLILGGKPKEGGITTLSRYFPMLARAYLIGAASAEFAATLAGQVEVEHCGTLDVAVAKAHAAAVAASTTTALRDTPEGHPFVLLSPACASYDQFRNFEQRGDAFRNLVLALPGLVPFGSEAKA